MAFVGGLAQSTIVTVGLIAIAIAILFFFQVGELFGDLKGSISSAARRVARRHTSGWLPVRRTTWYAPSMTLTYVSTVD